MLPGRAPKQAPISKRGATKSVPNSLITSQIPDQGCRKSDKNALMRYPIATANARAMGPIIFVAKMRAAREKYRSIWVLKLVVSLLAHGCAA